MAVTSFFFCLVSSILVGFTWVDAKTITSFYAFSKGTAGILSLLPAGIIVYRNIHQGTYHQYVSAHSSVK